jgi:hypothetical protein
MWQRRLAYRERLEIHQSMQRVQRLEAADWFTLADTLCPTLRYGVLQTHEDLMAKKEAEAFQKCAESFSRSAEYHAEMSRIYQYLACHPWFSEPPVPDEPTILLPEE